MRENEEFPKHHVLQHRPETRGVVAKICVVYIVKVYNACAVVCKKASNENVNTYHVRGFSGKSVL